MNFEDIPHPRGKKHVWKNPDEMTDEEFWSETGKRAVIYVCETEVDAVRRSKALIVTHGGFACRGCILSFEAIGEKVWRVWSEQ